MSEDFDKKLNDATQTHVNAPAAAAIIAFLLSIVLLTSVSNRTSSKYVVKYKGNKSLAIKGIETNNTSLRVMHFTDAANGMEYYNYINVGDTLDIKYNFNNLLTCDNYSISPFLRKVSNIKRINGKKLKEVKEIAKRDSMLIGVRQSNQKVK